jgi:hypothetical protein
VNKNLLPNTIFPKLHTHKRIFILHGKLNALPSDLLACFRVRYEPTHYFNLIIVVYSLQYTTHKLTNIMDEIFLGHIQITVIFTTDTARVVDRKFVT